MENSPPLPFCQLNQPLHIKLYMAPSSYKLAQQLLLVSNVNGPPPKRMLDHDSKPAFTESGIWAAVEPPEADELQKSLMEDINRQADQGTQVWKYPPIS